MRRVPRCAGCAASARQGAAQPATWRAMQLPTRLTTPPVILLAMCEPSGRRGSLINESRSNWPLRVVRWRSGSHATESGTRGGNATFRARCSLRSAGRQTRDAMRRHVCVSALTREHEDKCCISWPSHACRCAALLHNGGGQRRRAKTRVPETAKWREKTCTSKWIGAPRVRWGQGGRWLRSRRPWRRNHIGRRSSFVLGVLRLLLGLELLVIRFALLLGRGRLRHRGQLVEQVGS